MFSADRVGKPGICWTTSRCALVYSPVDEFIRAIIRGRYEVERPQSIKEEGMRDTRQAPEAGRVTLSRGFTGTTRLTRLDYESGPKQNLGSHLGVVRSCTKFVDVRHARLLGAISRSLC